jgi:hypothetical protein
MVCAISADSKQAFARRPGGLMGARSLLRLERTAIMGETDSSATILDRRN